MAPMIAENAQSNTHATQNTQAPTIQVTNEDEKPSPHKHKLFHRGRENGSPRHSARPLEAKTSRQRLSRSLSPGNREKSQASSTRKSFESTHEKFPNTNGTRDAAQRPPHARLETIQSTDVPEVPISANHDASPNAKQPLKPIPHNLEKVNSPPKHRDNPPEQDIRLPIIGPNHRTEPTSRFPKTVSQRHAQSILVKIWLVIAILYRRAHMFEDSREATDEAAKVAMKIEAMIASVESSARAFSDPGWGGGGKSSDELWADVYCERASLCMTIARAREEKDGKLDAEGVREAVEYFEQCLMYFADHPGGIVGLSNVLLDYFERKVELAKRIDNGKNKNEELVAQTVPDEPARPKHKREWSRGTNPTGLGLSPLDRDMDHAHSSGLLPTLQNMSRDDDLKKTPENLNRLAARDRAYGLLSALTKLGSGWDDSEAWFALARAHEAGGEVERAKEILWWCVELEDRRPIRGWACLGGYVL